MAKNEHGEHGEHSEHGGGGASGGKGHDKVTIHIDKDTFQVEQKSMTGAELRGLPAPPIGPERDLFQVVPGADDVPIADDQSVELKDGMHFFTAPSTITPGVDAPAC
jgi:hypothetical protein